MRLAQVRSAEDSDRHVSMEPEKATLLILNLLRIPAGATQVRQRWDFSASDWQQLAESADQLGVAPLLYFELRKAGRERDVLTSALQDLQRSFHQNAARNLRLYHELAAVLSRLDGLHVPVIVLKGAFLASEVYVNPALRVMSDLDILVPPHDVPAALEALKGLGYGLLIPPWINVGWHVEVASPDCLAHVEIHWQLNAPSKYHDLPVEDVWRSARPARIAGADVSALPPEELVIHLCYHTAVLHLYRQGLRSLADIDRTVRRYKSSLNWQEVTALSLARGLHKVVALTLHLCRQHLDTPVPDSTFQELHCAKIDSNIEQTALRQISSGPGAIESFPAGLWRVLSEESPMGKAGMLVKYIVSPARTAYQLPRAQSRIMAVYYVLRRAMYLMQSYGRTILLLLRPVTRDAQGAGVNLHFLHWLAS
jgi:Uncharacterised nucleotidyltransferase